jgi:uncharacterized protein
MSEPLKSRIVADMKAALRAGDKARLGAIRLMIAAIKQREIDSRSELDDAQTLAILDKMIKQRRESIAQYGSAGRSDLVAAEEFEIDVIQAYVAKAGSSGIQDMGKVMSLLKPQVQGRADMAAISARVKARLSSS